MAKEREYSMTMDNTRNSAKPKTAAKCGKAASATGARLKAKKALAENSKKTAKRGKGKPFAPGKSANPGGRPKIPEEVRDAARALSLEAIKILAGVMRGAKTRPGDKIRAAETLLNRAWGTPASSVEITGKDGQPIEVALIKRVVVGNVGR